MGTEIEGVGVSAGILCFVGLVANVEFNTVSLPVLGCRYRSKGQGEFLGSRYFDVGGYMRV